MKSAMVMPLPTKPKPAPAAVKQTPRSWPAPCLLPSLVSSFLLWMCFYPLAWGWLGWVALVPVLLLSRADARPRKIYFSAYAGGVCFFIPALIWMPVADYRMYATWAALSIYCALYFPVAILLIRRLDRATRWPLIVTVPLVWTALEFIRSFLLTGFAWYYLGHTQHDFLAMIQIADLGGVYAITFVVAMVNAWLVECLVRFPEVRKVLRLVALPGAQDARFVPWPIPYRQGLVVAGLLCAVLIYGAWRLSQGDFQAGPRVALLQGNLDQRIRNDASSEQSLLAIQKHYDDLCKIAMIPQLPRPDLVVWPETSFPFPWFEASTNLAFQKVPPFFRDNEVFVREHLRKLARDRTHLTHLFGINTKTLDEAGKEERWNSALLIDADGHLGGRYDKIHRVPFGEYVPLMDWAPFLKNFAPYEEDYSISRGRSLTRLKVAAHGKEFRFGVLICYEDTDPFLARQYGRQHDDGPPVDFLVNMSNDGWFDGSSEHEQHLAISRFRAIEARRAICRAVNMGISAVIDSNGRIQLPGEVADLKYGKLWAVQEFDNVIPDLPGSKWADYKKTAGVLYAVIPIDDRISVYAMFGDWLPGVCWLAIVAALAWAWRQSRQTKRTA